MVLHRVVRDGSAGRTSDDGQQDQTNLRVGLRKDFNLF